MLGINNVIKQKDYLEKFRKTSKVTGVIFIILGIIGIIYPVFMSVTTAYFLAWLLLFSGVTIAIHTWQNNKKDWLGWLKAFIFILTSILIVIDPLAGVGAAGLIIAIYLFMDAFASFALAAQNKGQKYWWLIIINGIISIILGSLFIIGWPITSMVLVGLYVGISLIFDGAVLLSMSSAIKEVEKEVEDSSNDTANSSSEAKA